jgi:hypothetical protein
VVPENTREAIALLIATGEPSRGVAERFDLTPRGLRGLLEERDMEDRIRSLQKRFEAEVITARNKVLVAWPEIVDATVEMARNSGKNQMRAIELCWSRLWPEKSFIEHSGLVTVESEVLSALAEGLKAANAARLAPRPSPRLLRGDEALVRLDAGGEPSNGTEAPR